MIDIDEVRRRLDLMQGDHTASIVLTSKEHRYAVVEFGARADVRVIFEANLSSRRHRRSIDYLSAAQFMKSAASDVLALLEEVQRLREIIENEDICPDCGEPGVPAAGDAMHDIECAARQEAL